MGKKELVILAEWQNDRPEGGQIVEGEKFRSMVPFWILYTRAEGASFEALGCHNEEQADAVLKRFEEQGDMENPRHYMSDINPPALKPYTMMKVRVESIKSWIPRA